MRTVFTCAIGIWFVTAAVPVIAQPPKQPATPTEGDKMIDAYLAQETDKISKKFLNGAKNLDAAYAYLNTALSPQAQAIMAKNMELNVSNLDAYKQLPPDLVKKLGPEQANELIAGSEFNILPDPDSKPPHVSIRDLYTAFDEIKAAVKK